MSTPLLEGSGVPGGMGRREALAALLASLAPGSVRRLAADPAGPRVAVVGAGMAGLAAVDRLSRAGLATVLVEARDRVGGRIWTPESGVDLGASWIHGLAGNPLVRLARNAGVPLRRFDYDRIQVHRDGERLSGAEEQDLDRLLLRLWSSVSRASRGAGDGASLEQAVARFRNSLPASRRPDLDYLVNTSWTHEFAADPARLSLARYDEGLELRGGDALVPSGYARLLGGFRPADESHFSRPVRVVRHGPDGVVLETDAGDIAADAAIVTVPLGVLKAGRIRFEPPLGPRHAAAIRRIGFGTLDKIYLRFPRRAWPRRPHLFGRIDRTRLWEEWVNFAPIDGRPVLMGFNAGRVAERLERRGDGAIVAGAMRALREIFGRSLPDPIEARATRWRLDPWSLGSYSSLAPGSSPRDRRLLASPIGARLMLAGEACSAESPATVHGAYRSGVAAAARLVETLG